MIKHSIREKIAHRDPDQRSHDRDEQASQLNKVEHRESEIQNL